MWQVSANWSFLVTINTKGVHDANDMSLGSPTLIPRVLEVVKSKLCWIVGTVYMDMALKPNVPRKT